MTPQITGSVFAAYTMLAAVAFVVFRDRLDIALRAASLNLRILALELKLAWLNSKQFARDLYLWPKYGIAPAELRAARREGLLEPLPEIIQQDAARMKEWANNRDPSVPLTPEERQMIHDMEERFKRWADEKLKTGEPSKPPSIDCGKF
jgi:hypothetical protein